MRDEFTEWQDWAKRGKLLDDNGVSTGQPHPMALHISWTGWEARSKLTKPLRTEPVGWRTIESAPRDGTDILIHYVTEHGRHVRCIAHWTAALTAEVDGNLDDDVGEYDEATDAWYVPEGWYENLYNWDEYRSVFIHEGKPDSWQPLPEPPKESSNG